MEYRYYLILKKTREFVVIAMPSTKDINVALLRYNAPVYMELDIHTYFSYIYKFYDGQEQYWENSGHKPRSSDTTTTMCH